MTCIALHRGRHVGCRLRLRTLLSHGDERSTVTCRALPRGARMVHYRGPECTEIGMAGIAGGSSWDVICRLWQSDTTALVTVGAALISNGNWRGILGMINHSSCPC